MKKILFVVLLLLASLNPAYAYSWDELKYVTKDDRFSYYIPIYAVNTVKIPFPGVYNHEALECDFVVSDNISLYEEHRILVSKSIPEEKWIYTRVFSVYKSGGKTKTDVYYVHIWEPLDFSDVLGTCVLSAISNNKKILK